jgi:hypothetical protein
MYRFRLASLLVFFALTFLNLTSLHAGENNSPPQFLSQLRILSESRGSVWKAYKSYLMLGMGNRYKDPKSALAQAITSYKNAINQSRTYIQKYHRDTVLPILSEADSQWATLKKMLMAPPDKTRVNAIDKLAMKLTRTIIKALKAMGTYDTSGHWLYIEQTQKAQNIAQRMATLYLAHVWGALDPKRYNAMMHKVVGNFTKVEKLIHGSKFLTKEMEAELKKAKGNFLFFTMMWRAKNNHFIPTLIYQKSTDLDKNMGKCTTMIMDQIQKES